MKLKAVISKFKKIIRREGMVNGCTKTQFIAILKNIANIENDPVDDSTVLVLKSFFQYRSSTKCN